jgi:hypothetical protein
MEMRLAVECKINWHSGKVRVVSAPGKNIRLPQSLIAASNFGRNQLGECHLAAQRATYNRDDLGGLIGESVSKLLVEGYQVGHVHIEHVGFDEDVCSKGISANGRVSGGRGDDDGDLPVNEIVIQTELQDEGAEGTLDFTRLILWLAVILGQASVDGENGGTIHDGGDGRSSSIEGEMVGKKVQGFSSRPTRLPLKLPKKG